MNRPLSSARLTLAVFFLALLAALVSGCSSGPTPLAKVGDQVITREDFLDVARRSQGQYQGKPDSVKAALLDDLIKRELLVLEARKRGLVSAEDRERLLRQAEEQLALRKLIQSLVPENVPVSDAEIQTLYRQRANEAHTLVVFTPDSASIERALAEIRGGADFGAVADRFNTTGMTPPHGDLSFRTPGSLIPSLDGPVAESPVGKVTGPIESMGDGWFLVKVIERRPRTERPLDQEREGLRRLLEGGKRRVLLDRAQREMLAQYHVRIEPGAAQMLFTRYNAPKDTTRIGQTPVPVPAPPTPKEAQQVLMRYDSLGSKPATYTLTDALQDLQNGSTGRPNLAMTSIIEQWLKSVALQRVLRFEVQRRHLEQEPTVVREARERMKNELLQAAYNTLVMNSITTNEDDIRAAYERHKAQLVRLQSAKLRLASFSDSTAAAKVGQAAATAKKLEEAMRTAGAEARVVETEIRFPTTDPLWTRLQGELMQMNAGQIGGPVRAARGWLMIQLVDKTVALEDYAKIDATTRQDLQTEALEIKRDQRLNAVTDSLRQQYRPVVYSKRLAAIPWPVPPAKSGT